MILFSSWFSIGEKKVFSKPGQFPREKEMIFRSAQIVVTNVQIFINIITEIATLCSWQVKQSRQEENYKYKNFTGLLLAFLSKDFFLLLLR